MDNTGRHFTEVCPRKLVKASDHRHQRMGKVLAPLHQLQGLGLRALEQVEIYHYPSDDAAEKKMLEYFKMVAGEDGKRGGTIEVLGREIDTVRRANGVIWFDFRTLCGGPRSQNDYLEISRSYHTVLLSHIPKMTQHQASEARRLTWLVDVFYDHRVKLIATADCAADQLYTEGTQATEFTRTVSRLTEMNSREYLALAHIPAE